MTTSTTARRLGTALVPLALTAGVVCAGAGPAQAATGSASSWSAFEATAPSGHASSDHARFTIDSPTIQASDVGKTVVISVTGRTGVATPDVASLHLQWYDGSRWHQGTGVSAPITNGPTTGLKMPVTAAMVGQRAQLYGQLSMPSTSVGGVTVSGAVALGQGRWTTSTSFTAASDVPAPAAGAGFSRLSFATDFGDLRQVDLSGKGVAGHQWFTDRPFGGGTLPTSSLKVSGGATTITQTDAAKNMALATTSPTSGAGTSFHYGYFEAKMTLDPSQVNSSTGWPSFWLMSSSHWDGQNASKWGEIDIMEMFADAAGHGNWAGTVWDHTAGAGGVVTNTSNGPDNNQLLMPGVDWSKPHVYGLLWTKGQLTWYMDGVQVRHESYGEGVVPTATPGSSSGSTDVNGTKTHVDQLPAGTFSQLDSSTSGPMTMVLGSGDHDPATVSWVHVYQH